MKSLDQILDSRDGDQQGDTQPDAKPQGAPAATTEPDAATAQGEAKAPATDAGKPGAQAQDPDDQHADPEDRSPEALLRALRSERDERKKERQDHKGRAARFEGEAAELRRQRDALQAQLAQQQIAREAGMQGMPGHQQQRDPVELFETFVGQRVQGALLEERANADEEHVRAELGDEAVDEMFAIYRQLIERMPELHQRALQSRRPWQAMVNLVKQHTLQTEVGTDLDAFKERIRAEERAKLEAEFSARQQAAAAAPVAQRPHLPRSLAAARAAGGASTPTFTGPTPLTAIVNRRS